MENDEKFDVIQCGEIFISRPNSQFKIVCFLCENSFEEFENFSNHILQFNCCHYNNVNIESEPLIPEIIEKTISELKFDSTKGERYFDSSDDVVLNKNQIEVTNDLNTDNSQSNITNSRDFNEESDWSDSDNQTISEIKEKKEISTDYNSRSDAERIIYSCEFCDKTYLCKTNFRNHTKLQHTKLNLLTCDLCKKNFASTTTLRHHIKSHLQEKPYKCNYCSKSFTTNTLRNKHERATHQKIKPYKCNLCDKAFSSMQLLRKHDVVHSKKRPFKCNLCPMDYTQKYSLFVHKRTKHPEEIPLKCEICSKRFTTDFFLKNHECQSISSKVKSLMENKGDKEKKPYRRKNFGEILQCGVRISNKGEELPIYKKLVAKESRAVSSKTLPFICEHCGKGYRSLFQAEVHKRVHTGEKPFKCSDCDRAFVSKQQLKHHFTIHTGEKPYKCLQCQKCFRTHFRLVVHIRSHTGERPFRCKISTCNKAFHSLHNFNEHTKNVHKINK